jgi:hypothetical protein
MPNQEGMSAADTWDQEVEIVQDDEGQGGHAGGGVSSIEEIHRPGVHYIVTKSGVSYHGKSFAPEETPRGGAHVTVFPGGKYKINAGEMSPMHEYHLKMALRK